MDSPKIEAKVEVDLTRPIEQLTDAAVSASTFVGNVLAPSIEASGGIISDQIKHWRALNLSRIEAKWLKKLGDRGISPSIAKKLPFEIGVPLLEAASMVSDEEVQELWASLLGNATNPSHNATINRIHIEILRAISANEIRILKFLYSPPAGELYRSAYEELDGFGPDKIRAALLNLRRQECIRVKLDRRLLSDVIRVDDILADGNNVEKQGLKDAFNALRGLIEDLSGHNDNKHLRSAYGVTQFELTDLGRGLMELCAEPVPT